MRNSLDGGFQKREGLPSILPLSDNRVQIQLAKRSFLREHEGEPVNGNEVMSEWNKEHAEQYRAFVSDPEHMHETIDLGDNAALERVLEQIFGADATIH